MKLDQLLRGIVEQIPSGSDVEVTGITHDSRRVEKGFVFAAIAGENNDGHRFLPDAVRRGASALIVSHPSARKSGVPEIIAADTRSLLADLSARFFEEPTLSLRVFGVTGTNGKTTVTYLLESILKESGRTPGVIGTINYRFGGRIESAPNTTPESDELQSLFSEMRQGGVTDAVLEVSSHALSQGRVRGTHFDGAAFTNLSRDHLDYHGDLAGHFNSKKRLFNDFLPASRKSRKFAVLNAEDPRSRDLESFSPVRTIRTGLHEPCDVFASSFDLSPKGIRAEILTQGRRLTVTSPLLGRHNLENILVAVGLGHGAGLSPEAISVGIGRARSVPGRLESIPNRRGVSVYVDYAHTPNALTVVGRTLKGLTRGRLITLFGCGGDRDPGKRPEMAKEAAQFSDFIIVTSDNPRGEDPESIIDQIVGGLKEVGFSEASYCRITDRRDALEKGVEMARAGDTLLVAGKGHEDYQILGERRISFSDQKILKELLGDEADDR